MLTRSVYQQRFAELFPELDPRHIEAWLRLEYGVLDHLRLDSSFVRPFADMVRACPNDSESLAKSYGL